MSYILYIKYSKLTSNCGTHFSYKKYHLLIPLWIPVFVLFARWRERVPEWESEPGVQRSVCALCITQTHTHTHLSFKDPFMNNGYTPYRIMRFGNQLTQCFASLFIFRCIIFISVGIVIL